MNLRKIFRKFFGIQHLTGNSWELSNYDPAWDIFPFSHEPNGALVFNDHHHRCILRTITCVLHPLPGTYISGYSAKFFSPYQYVLQNLSVRPASDVAMPIPMGTFLSQF
jgi:hypothetical protein